MEKRTRRRLCSVLALVAVCFCFMSGTALADEYLGTDWWLEVSTEDSPWLNGSFTVAGYDRWGNHFTHKGNRIEIGRGPVLGAFYVTGSTRLTLAGQDFGSNFYPVSMSTTATPILNGGSVEISTDGKNQLTINIQSSPALGQINTRIVFDGVSKAVVSNALETKITSSFQSSGCSEIMSSYMVDGVIQNVGHYSQMIVEAATVWALQDFDVSEIFGVMGGGTLNAPSIFIRMPSELRSGYYQRDLSSNPSDDNVYLGLYKPIPNYTVEAWSYGSKLNSDFSIEIPCVSVGGDFYYLRFDYVNQAGTSLLWRLGEIYLTKNNYSYITVGNDLRLTIPDINLEKGINYSAVLDYYGADVNGYYWQLSSAMPDPCNTK